ncbi:MAG: methylmalonyl-CoA mutase family protein, partial [Candidatus Puniceispirillales bacterium]
RRLARNSHHIMAAEARLDQVVDPAAGSFFIDSMTRDLAQAAWQRFQAIEAEGGIIAASGRLADEAREAVQMRQQAVNQGQESLLGVTRHPQREAGLAPVLISSGAVPRGGAQRPAAIWEDLVESHRGRHHRILCLDIGTATKAAAAASWIQLAGVEATVTQAETVDAALEMIAAARPDHLVLGADTEDQERLAAKAEPRLNITPADRFDGDKMEALTELLGGAA